MKTCQITILTLFLWIVSCSASVGQTKAIISLENPHLIANIDNPIRIVAQQNTAVSISQLTATLQGSDSGEEPIAIVERAGHFIINPKKTGRVKINIRVGDTVETKTLQVRPIEALGRLGRHKANSDEKISVGEFKVQSGIMANIECCGFDAKCQVLGFKAIRISNRNQAERATNTGGRFGETTKKMILKAEPGDTYIFRQIRYRCPGSERPQRLHDMIFEIK